MSYITCIKYCVVLFLIFSFSYTNAQTCTDSYFSFGVIADCQYCNCPNSTNINSVSKLTDAVNYFNQSNIEFCVHLGDFFQNGRSNLDTVLPIYQNLNAPHYFALGNHEFDITSSEKLTLINDLGMPNYYYSYDVYNWRFIVLESTELAFYSEEVHLDKINERDSIYALYGGATNSGGISIEQLNWLEQQIQNAEDSFKNVILFAHHPVFPDDQNRNIWNDTEVINILEAHSNVVAFMNGHRHAGNYGIKNNIHYVTFQGMLLTNNDNSFAQIFVKEDTVYVDGIGRESDKTLHFTNVFNNSDADNDGICDVNDVCPNFDDNLIGQPCDDNDVCTVNETYDNTCACTNGVFLDADNDGICDANDVCANFDDNLIGQPCNDNDACTANETYDNSCTCTNGIFLDADNDGICDANDVCTNFNDNLIGQPCDDLNVCTNNETYDNNCNCANGVSADSDNDGICDALDQCPNFNDSLIGQACDDGDICTVSDTYDSNCTCNGIFLDADNDGICDANDLCANFNDNLIGQPCDDGDNCTINETYDAACNCTNGALVEIEITAVLTEATPGSNDGAIDVTVQGGVPPYNFFWANGATTEDINNIIAGTYWVIVSDDNGCSDNQTFNVENNNQITCDSVANIQLINLTNSGATLFFPSMPNSLDYSLFYKDINDPTYQTINSMQNFFVLNNLTDCTSYQYYIVNNCLYNFATSSSIYYFSTNGCQMCGTNQNTSTTNITPESAILQWDLYPNSSYDLFLKLDTDPDYTEHNLNFPFAILFNLNAGSTYQWYVVYKCENGLISAPSNVSVFSTLD